MSLTLVPQATPTNEDPPVVRIELATDALRQGSLAIGAENMQEDLRRIEILLRTGSVTPIDVTHERVTFRRRHIQVPPCMVNEPEPLLRIQPDSCKRNKHGNQGDD